MPFTEKQGLASRVMKKIVLNTNQHMTFNWNLAFFDSKLSISLKTNIFSYWNKENEKRSTCVGLDD